MDEHISQLEGILDEMEGFVKVRRHFVAGQVEGIDDFVIDLLILRVVDAQHGGRCEDWVAIGVPDLISRCLSSFRLVAA